MLKKRCSKHVFFSGRIIFFNFFPKFQPNNTLQLFSENFSPIIFFNFFFPKNFSPLISIKQTVSVIFSPLNAQCKKYIFFLIQKYIFPNIFWENHQKKNKILRLFVWICFSNVTWVPCLFPWQYIFWPRRQKLLRFWFQNINKITRGSFVWNFVSRRIFVYIFFTYTFFGKNPKNSCMKKYFIFLLFDPDLRHEKFDDLDFVTFICGFGVWI